MTAHSKSSNYDCIVLGLGGFGSSALAHLARNGVQVLGIDRFPPVHSYGSSHGQSRIIRKAYFEHPDYVPLLKRAYKLWSQLERETDRKLYYECGLMMSGPGKGPVIAGSRLAAKLHSLPLEDVPRSQLAARFPTFRFPDEHEVVFEPEAGYLLVEDCIRAHLDTAARFGADSIFGEEVVAWSASKDSVEVETRTDTYTAGRLVIAGGAWSSQILTDVLPELRVLRKVLLWHAVEPEHSSLLMENPAFLFDLPDGAIYGFPSLDGMSLKLAEHHGGAEVLDPLTVDRTLHPVDEKRIRDFVRSSMYGVRPQVVDHAVCMYTMSPDEHFIIDHHPRHPHVVFAAGFSGHGFKFASVLGEVIAELTLFGRTTMPIDFLSLKRFAIQ